MLQCQWSHLITLRPRPNGRHFPDDIWNAFFFKEYVWISITISLRFVPKSPINNIPTLVQIMAWRRPGDKPLSEPMTVSLLTHICVTRPQWVKGYHIQSQIARFVGPTWDLPGDQVGPRWAPWTLLSGVFKTKHELELVRENVLAVIMMGYLGFSNQIIYLWWWGHLIVSFYEMNTLTLKIYGDMCHYQWHGFGCYYQ